MEATTEAPRRLKHVNTVKRSARDPEGEGGPQSEKVGYRQVQASQERRVSRLAVMGSGRQSRLRESEGDGCSWAAQRCAEG